MEVLKLLAHRLWHKDFSSWAKALATWYWFYPSPVILVDTAVSTLRTLTAVVPYPIERVNMFHQWNTECQLRKTIVTRFHISVLYCVFHIHSKEANSVVPFFCRCHLTGALATACGDDAIRVFEEEPLSDPQQPTFTLTAHMARAHSQDVNCVAWNPKEPGLLASCSDDGEMAFWKYQHLEAYWRVPAFSMPHTWQLCTPHPPPPVSSTDNSATFRDSKLGQSMGKYEDWSCQACSEWFLLSPKIFLRNHALGTDCL